MKRIAYSNATRIIAFILMQLLVMTSLSLALYFGNTIINSNYAKEVLQGKTYLESSYFREQVVENVNRVNQFIECQKDFEVSGEFNGNKEVTISQFLSSDKDVSEYSLTHVYKLQDLVDWSQEGVESEPLFQVLLEAQNIDKLKGEFPILAKGVLEIQDTINEGVSDPTKEEAIFNALQSLGINISSDMLYATVVKENYEPIAGYDTLLGDSFRQADFSNMEKISGEIQEALNTVLEEYRFYKQYETYLKGLDSSNFKVYIRDYRGEVILNNCMDENTDYLAYFNGELGYKIGGGIIYNAENKEFSFTDRANDSIYLDMFKIPDEVNYIYAVGVDTTYPHEDEFSLAEQAFHNSRYIIIGMIASILMILFCFIYLTVVSGRKVNDKTIHLNGFDRIKTEIAAFVMISLGIIGIFAIEITQYSSFIEFTIVIGLALESGLFTLGFLSLIKRIKAGQLWKNSVIYSIISWIIIFIKNRKATTKIAVMYAIYIVVTFVLLAGGLGGGSLFLFLLWVAFAGLVGFALLKEAVARQKILSGVEKISGGDLEYKIDSTSLTGSNKVLAHAINNIGEGLHNAVDASVRNERLKTDLITNVSHDIKTPLTSIINYVDLIKRENIEDDKVRSYIEILDDKSQRLKNLTEDLVEASKISSGNIKLEMGKIDFVELINQTEGEFSEKFEAKGLKIIKTLSKEHVTIMADGRRIWRVVENLYNNVAKYAMPNTRVYVDIHVNADDVVFIIKNISENPLNIHADELTERFIRGDVSRSTEGSGLGLSIAKNLTTLQKGTFDIYLDGDLFRVTIAFPCVES